ncbi:alpha/beta fold hydrolase [Pseudonocardia broussonetiae]|uniref:alpha/beta fold hydrolase n=1 Tax=Pseudonocardia broussonetiae TaxID=2736640 RepID=UPI001962B55D|nr:alpha/beta hydrolase [Pseudonocardia broussonetiae]
MTTFVLVHGAYHGGWCWRRVADLLRRQGHTVFTPTLTGLGERAHLLGPEVGLTTMIDDVVAVVEAEELTDVVLVGHSFGALPVLGATGPLAPRLRRPVILDGIVVEPGSHGFAGLSADLVEARREAARRHPSGLAIPPPPAEFFGVIDPADRAWVERRLTAHPLRTYTDPMPDGPWTAGLLVTYLRCTDPVFPGVAGVTDVVLGHGGRVLDLAAPHDAMITHPDLLVAELVSLADE